MRATKTREQWHMEWAYCDSIDPRNPGKSFNHDPLCFSRYTAMQAKFCRMDGHTDLADRIAACGFH